MIRRIFISFFLLMFSFFIFDWLFDNKDNSSLAESSFTAEQKTLIFLGNKDIPPMVYLNNGKPEGIIVDIAKTLGSEMDRRVEIKAMNWQEAQEEVVSGEADALLQINPTEQREKDYDFSDSLLESKFTIFVAADRRDILTIDDLNKEKVGVEKEGYPIQILQKHPEIETVVIPDWKTGFSMVESGKLDAVLVDRWVGEYVLAKSNIKNIKLIENPVEVSYSRIAVKKGNRDLLNSINQGLQKMKNDGTMRTILDNWHNQKVVFFTQSDIKKVILWGSMLFIFVILFATGVIIVRIKKMNVQLKSEVEQRTCDLKLANSKLEKANRKLWRLSSVDALTNIANRWFFRKCLRRTWNICQQHKNKIAIIMSDIDHFKQYNDTYGHLAGDDCLKIVASVMKNIAKENNALAVRFGGEEFIVLIEELEKENIIAIAEKIRMNIAALKDLKRLTTISVGVSIIIPDDNLSPHNLVDAADKALYQAKREGRNRICVNDLCAANTDGIKGNVYEDF
ncbi:diguanylate cyclase domain-containing protein [Pectinatus frisingensis]|uniref:diguanylate cyclase domain-containing protein n=1 Tax=Pectinatus frisingensis TaxID=865 RepID=UPI0018C7FED5|nr:transporter substrate-binding domain-containing protein [Pectinatus frisingensis]